MDALPNWKTCSDNVAAGTATPLERFIYENEPLQGDDEFRQSLQRALEFTGHLPANLWIEVAQCVPQTSRRVLIFDPTEVGSRVRMGEYHENVFVAVDGGGWDTLPNVTHWQELPTGPAL
jgi:hypothetical protein